MRARLTRLGFPWCALLLVTGCTADAPQPRVPHQPTLSGQLPPAILGEAAALQGRSVRYVDGDSNTLGYLAVPEGEGPFPAVLLIHEWNGLVDRVRHVADAFAAEGYVALAVDLYQSQTGATREENMALMTAARAEPGAMIDNLNAAARFVRARPDVTGRVGAMGWCFGGGVALSFALGGENHDATAIFYGSLVDDPERLRALTHEVYGTFAGLDQGPSPEEVQRFAAALREAEIDADLHIYDDVNHGFWLHVDQGRERREGPAVDAWERLKAYLNRTLGG